MTNCTFFANKATGGAGGNGGGAHTVGEWFDPAGRELALERLALLILLLAGSPAEGDSGAPAAGVSG
jgi:hypothetical protein